MDTSHSDITPLPQVVELIGELVRHDSSNPPGREQACVLFIKDLLDRYGGVGRVHALDPTRPNLVYRVTGRGEARPLLLYGHVDVVPADSQAWTMPPFGGLIRDGFLWGRGTLDMKGGLAMLIRIFLECLRSPPPGDVILAVVSDEERGGRFGSEYLVSEHSHEFCNVRHAIGEFGGFTMNFAGRKIMPVQVAEKAYCCVDLTFNGPGGHASAPLERSAAQDVGVFLQKVGRTPMPVHISRPAATMLAALADVADDRRYKVMLQQLQNRFLAPLIIRALPFHTRRLLEPLIRSNITPTVIAGGTSRNSIPQQIVVKCDSRLVPEQSVLDLKRHITRLVPTGCLVDVEESRRITQDVDSSQFPLIVDVVRKSMPGVTPIPTLLPATTDARHFASLDIQTYGFLPMELPSSFNFMSMIHGADERVPVASLEPGLNTLRMFVERYR